MAQSNYYDPNAIVNQQAQQRAQAANPFSDTPNQPQPSYFDYQGSAAQQPNYNDSGNSGTNTPSAVNPPSPYTNAPQGWYDPNGNIAPGTNTPNVPNPPNTPPQSGSGYKGGKDLSSLISYYQGNNPINLDGLLKFLQDNGISASRAKRAGGQSSDDKIVVDGKTYDLIRDVGGSGAAWQFIDESQGGAQAGGGAPTAPPQSPMVMGDGTIPPGIPYSPTPAPQMNPNANNVLNDILTKPVYDQNYLNQLNEQQKELALTRNNQLGGQLLQSAASRNVTNGGQLARRQSELSNDLTKQLLQSNRDVNIQTTGANRQGFLDALTQNSSMFRDQLAGSQFGADENLRVTQQRRADQELARLIEQYNRDNTYRYDNMNNSNNQNLINILTGRTA